jgi:hypothetical protein
MSKIEETILNIVVGIILLVGGIASTWVVLYPRLTFDKASRYIESNPSPINKDYVEPTDSILICLIQIVSTQPN